MAFLFSFFGKSLPHWLCPSAGAPVIGPDYLLVFATMQGVICCTLRKRESGFGLLWPPRSVAPCAAQDLLSSFSSCLCCVPSKGERVKRALSGLLFLQCGDSERRREREAAMAPARHGEKERERDRSELSSHYPELFSLSH